MGKHVKDRKRALKQQRRKNRQRWVVRSTAGSMAGLLVGGMLTFHFDAASSTIDAAGSTTVHEDVSLAASIIFIDGHDYPYGSTRMADEITGQYQYQSGCPPTPPCTHLTAPITTPTPPQLIFINQFDQYPGTLGLIDGPTAPTGDESVALGQQSLHAAITSPTTTTPITVVAYSEGAVAASHEVAAPGLPAGTAFVLIGDPERPNGGILARMPAGTYIPVLGITGGNATSSTGAPVVMVTKQYDGIADAPVYLGNVVADVNALLGAYYLHGSGNYFDVNPNALGNIVTTSPDGNMTDILVPAAPGALPIFIPLAQAGVPQSVLVALDPLVRAIIETGYVRTTDPSQQVMFAFLPPPSAFSDNAQAIAAGFTLTAQELPAALAAGFPGLPVLPAQLPASTSPTPSPVPVTVLAPSPSSQTPLSSQLQPTPQGEQRIANPANNTWTELVQQNTSTPTTLSTKVTAPANTDTTDMTNGNKVKPDQEPPTNPTKHATGVLENVQQRVATHISHPDQGLTNASDKVKVNKAGPSESVAGTEGKKDSGN